MGADLYINSLSDPLKEKYQPLFDKWVDIRNDLEEGKERDKAQENVSKYYDKMFSEKGYFRDSYNCSSIMWQYDMSWWSDMGNGAYINDEGEMTPDSIYKLIELLDLRKKIFEENLQSILKGTNEHLDNASDSKTESGRKDWVKYFREKDKSFRAFLKNALDLEECIYCSI